MRSPIAILAASALGAFAQESSLTTSLFLGGPPAPGQAYVGSVISAGPSDTTYELICTATEACGTLSVPQTLTIGPSHLNFEFVTSTMGIEASASETCKISGTASAACEVEFRVDLGVTQTAITTSVTFTGSELDGVAVTLTAGVEKLASATAGSASGGSAASTSGSSSIQRSSTSAASSASAASVSGSGSGASSLMSNGKGGDVLALVMFSTVAVSVSALMIL